MNGLFLADDELRRLTGRSWKSLQIEWLRAEGLPFRISATGHPVVTRAAIEGRPIPEAAQAGWRSRALDTA